jgi:glutathione synthase/RimK-type ligase-like ATP-grasp enzyme
MAQQCNLKVPETIISTDKKYLLAFLKKHPCITKGITNAFSVHNGKLRTGFTTNVSESDLQTYEPQGCPTLLQKAITPHAMWRIVVVGKKIFGFRFIGPLLLTEADSRKVELSLDGEYLSAPPVVQENLLKMCTLLSIEFASADFIEDENGDIWFLDLNPEGQWAFLEEKFSVRISDAIVNLGMVKDRMTIK